MEQIYYTQCPVGYGLGASNGFQIKRLSPGYPLNADFRHLGLRAFPAGGRVIAPATLRYRRDGAFAEVAWLTPRAQEYETERGLWGRPGGHFAHGIRLEPAELAAIRHWPAGLADAAFWRSSDKEPTRGRPPEEISLGPGSLVRPPTFADVAPWLQGEDPEILATLLTAVAAAALEARTLYLIDDPARLASRVACLTFAFPEAYRSDLTFSTYHDRPEELPGYRIQGTSPLARPNRPALNASGLVADLTTGQFEPRVEPARWARSLATWLTRREPADESDWSRTDEIARQPSFGVARWNTEWLDHLFGFPEATRDRSKPAGPDAWNRLAGFAQWSAQAGLGAEWARSHQPDWWLESLDGSHEALEALEAQTALKDAWKLDDAPATWGAALAKATAEQEPSTADAAIATVLAAAPRAARPAFAQALLKNLPSSRAAVALDRLRNDPACDRAMLLPLEASAAVAAILEGGDPATLRAIVIDARSLPGAIPAVLGAVEAGAVDDATELAEVVAPAFDPSAPGGGREGWSWALRRPEPADWLRPALRAILADPGRLADWRAIRDGVPEPLRPVLAVAWLAIADDPGLPDEPFRWGVENLLMPLKTRPVDPRWAEVYLRRTPSGLDLLRRLVAPEFRQLGVPEWIRQARARGEISREQEERVETVIAFARALQSRDPRTLLTVDIPGVPADERGRMLGQMLANLGAEGLPFVLDACRDAWPRAFDPGAAGLASLAVPLARTIAARTSAPDAWLQHAVAMLDRLGLLGPGARGYEPDGLAAELVAASSRSVEPAVAPWPLRQFLLRDDQAWPTLTLDLKRDLNAAAASSAPEVILEWDRRLTKDRPERFWTVALNACDPPRMLAVVAARAADLKSLPALPWWSRPGSGGPNDLREAFARAAPLGPLPEGTAFQVRPWVAGSGKGTAVPEWLSTQGWARWRCFEALTNFIHAGTDGPARWPVVLGWGQADLTLNLLTDDDRHRFVAWLILGLAEAESFQIAQLAKWLHDGGLEDFDRLSTWGSEIGDAVEVGGQVELFRSRMVHELRAELLTLAREASQPRSRPAVRKERP